ncbi:hypothetical protein JZ751_010916 [Albula glossodonta]|uniref:Uncharacterized protein n=1 Tax=Albula glossodonta TaxID=121402 RepID=A0A8T2P6G0_9TELE|nr:hypothetical protein JZ751_010916 [Albula glossodonta]
MYYELLEAFSKHAVFRNSRRWQHYSSNHHALTNVLPFSILPTDSMLDLPFLAFCPPLTTFANLLAIFPLACVFFFILVFNRRLPQSIGSYILC